MRIGKLSVGRQDAIWPGQSPMAWLAAVFVGLSGGLAATVVDPLLLIAALIGASALAMPFFLGYRVFWAYLACLLLGYLLLGKGFAYVGVAPLYMAELGLILGAVSTFAVLLSNGFRPANSLRRPQVILLLVFMAWQAMCTVPYLGTYGIDALRDAALWVYGAFVIFILLLIPAGAVDRLFVLYGKILPWFLLYLPVAWLFVKLAPVDLYFPGSPVPLLYLKSGDVGVHLAGAAAFMLLRLDTRGQAWSTAKLWLMWGLWTADWVAWGASNRAGMLSALVGIAVVLAWRPRTSWYRPLVVGMALLVLLFVADISGPSFGRQNEISSEQIISNVTSTFGGGSSQVLESTREWRINWWTDILGYTFGGEHFWVGKGYGVNLASDDGYQVRQDDSIRAPHNVSMSVLARSGVPGLALWLAFLASVAWALMNKSSAKSTAGFWGRRYALWLLAYWMAFLFNGSFDVFIEGPMGGVWFWSIVGMSLVYLAGNSRPQDTPQGRYN